MVALPTADDLPAPLVTREQWVAWQTRERDGKPTKVPVNPATGNFASATDPDTWTDFATAREHAAGTADGVGFVFTDDDPIVGVDLDDCRDPNDGSLADWARDIADRLDSFTEVSPSGTGLHVLIKGELPDGRNRHGDVEFYDTARFFTVTGDELSETPSTLESRQEALTAVHADYVAQDDASGTEAPTSSSTPAGDSATRPSGYSAQAPGNDLGDEELLSRARSASNGEKFQRLWRGDTAGYPSQSEADMALCSLLAFWTGGDAEQMDRLFRESGLLRPKWNEQHFADGATYGERMIERAIAGTDEFYTQSSDDTNSVETVRSRTTSTPDASDLHPDAEATVPVSVVEDLEAEIQRLQADVEALREELAAERSRRKALEVSGSDDGSETRRTGRLSRFLPWLE